MLLLFFYIKTILLPLAYVCVYVMPYLLIILLVADDVVVKRTLPDFLFIVKYMNLF